MPSNPFEYANGMRDKITAKESQEIQQMYVELGKKIDALGKKYGKKDTASAPLQQMYYTQLKKQVEAWSKELSNGVYSKVTQAIGSVSDAVVKDNAKWLESLGFNKDHISAAFSNVNQSVVNSIVTGKIYGGKSGSWSLSKSIWGDNEKNLKTIYRIVAEGMTMQMGVQEIAENIRDFVDPTKKLDWTGPDGIKIYGRKTDYNAQRLVRTLSQHAYQKSVSQVAWDNPFISKIKWIANGSRVCEICKKRNGKVYALSKLPLDHPNGMCVMEPVIDDDITDQLADWVNGKETKKTKGIDKFADLLGYDKDELAKSLLKSTGKHKAGIADKAKNVIKDNTKSTLAENEVDDDKLLSNLLDKFKNQTTDKMLSIGNKALDGLTEEQFKVLKSYTGSAYTEINDYLRKSAIGEMPSAWLDKDTIDSIEDTVKAFSSIKTKEDYALRRGTDANDIFYTFLSGNPSMKEKINSLVISLEDDLFAPGGGVNEEKLQEHIDEISSLIKGQTGNFVSFTSTSSSWDKGFKGDVEYVIDAPKGTAGTSIMSISHYGISEGEFLLAPGTKVICEKVEAARDGHKRALVKVFLKVLV
ncbi:MAG: minor capsid protein 2 [Bacteriophage sp.]|nr:MAG: minor capsid protein 2 [Bacteriophage sp.]